MFVTIKIRVQTPFSLIQVPEAAIRPGKRVWTVREGKLQIVGPVQLVKLVSANGKQREADAGEQPQKHWLIEPHDQIGNKTLIVQSPLSTASQGMPVELKAEAE